MFRTAGFAALLAVAVLGCSSSDGGGNDNPDGDVPPGSEEILVIDGPAEVDRDQAEANLDE